MTRKDYKKVANALKAVKEDNQIKSKEEALYYLFVYFSEYFKADNPKFDKEKFKEACNLTNG